MSTPSMSTEAGLAGQHPSQRFNQRERKLLASVKTYVDSLSPDTVITTEGDLIVGNASGNAARLALGAANTLAKSNGTTVTYAKLVNADVDAAAAIAYSKLNLASSILNADVAAGAAIAYSKLALSNSLVAGDLTAGSVTLAKLASGVSPSHVAKFAGTFTTAGGDTAETITVTGALATDIVVVTVKTVGASPTTITAAAANTDAIDVTMAADPSTDHVLQYVVFRAAA